VGAPAAAGAAQRQEQIDGLEEGVAEAVGGAVQGVGLGADDGAGVGEAAVGLGGRAVEVQRHDRVHAGPVGRP
jgi:hypothetical protein